MLPGQRRNYSREGFLSVLLVLFCVVSSAAETSPDSNPDELDQKASAARAAIVRADRLCADWTQLSFRQAIPQYERASLIWSSISDFASASFATRKSAEVYFRLSDFPEALKRYQNAITLAER